MNNQVEPEAMLKKRVFYSHLEYRFKHKTGVFCGFVDDIYPSGLMKILLTKIPKGPSNLSIYDVGEIKCVNIRNVEIKLTNRVRSTRRKALYV